MKHTIIKLPKSQIELKITVEPSDYEEDMKKACLRLSQRSAISGFRPGKAPYDIVKKQMGELQILKEAMQSIVETNLRKALELEKIQTIGMPDITIEKMAPGNDFIFKAVAAVMPKIKLGDISKIKITKKNTPVEDNKVDEVIENLRKMQTKEVLANRACAPNDKILIDMDMQINKVPVEGGQAKNHAVYLSEKHYIPGLNEQLVGLTKGQTKEFSLKFPKEHYQKHLAGRNVDFTIKVIDVFELQHPEIDDAFAKSLRVENLEKLKSILKTNLQAEQDQKDDQKIEIFEKLIKDSEFNEIPEVLINAEKQKMFHELKHRLTEQGINIEKYLNDLKKTEQEIYNDFTEQANKRVKSALVSREVASQNNIKAEKSEIEKEIDLIKKSYPKDENVEKNLQNPDVLGTLAIAVQNRKVVQWLKEKVIKDK
ncbi:MAG: trigger factor [bacterium]